MRDIGVTGVQTCALPISAEAHGADAVSLINTLRGMALDPDVRFQRAPRPWLGGGTGGVSGPAGRAIALAQEIGRASCRGRVEMSVVAVSLKKKIVTDWI